MNFCSQCSHPLKDNPWPKHCLSCGHIHYRNPIPVGVVLLPCPGGVVAIRRNVEPQRGQLALPGGFIDWGESWQEGAARELFEETGIRLEPASLTLLSAVSVPGLVILFCQAPPLTTIPELAANAEVQELVVLEGPVELAFEAHTEVLRAYFG